MASEITNSRLLYLEANRHSPRIFHKNLTKLDVLDISAVNSKTDFMRSLNLFCVSGKTENHLKNNLEAFSLKNNFSLKECSVVISDLKCEVCGQLIKDRVDMQYHKKLHCCLIDKVFEHSKDSSNKQSVIDNCHRVIMKENFVECNNNNFILSKDKGKVYKKNMCKKRSKDQVTKVTLKIGGEIISKVYCKKKYLNKICLQGQSLSSAHDPKSCKNCEEIKHNLCSAKLNKNMSNRSTSENRKCDTELNDRNISRLRKMAALLVECELQRKRLQNLEESDFLHGNVEVSNSTDDAVVPDSNGTAENDVDDDIQEVLRISHCTSNARLQRHKLTTVQDYEIITIDDEICDNFEEDCVIINDPIPDEHFLNAEENSYVFHVSNENNTNKIKPFSLENERTLSEKRKLFSSSIEQDNMCLKRKENRNTIYTTGNGLENLDSYETRKKNEQHHDPTVNYSQFALPLRLINF